MNQKKDFSAGELVTMSDLKDCEIIKLLTLSAKVKLPDGTLKVAPYGILQKQGDSKKPAKEKPTKEKPKSRRRRRRKPADMKVTKKVLGKERTETFLPGDDDKKPAVKKATKKTVKKVVKAIKKVIKKKTSVSKVTPSRYTSRKVKPKQETKVYKNKPDKAALYLDGTKSINVLLKRMKDHKSFVAINEVAFKKMRSQKDELPFPVLKMRCLNMLRAAIRKM